MMIFQESTRAFRNSVHMSTDSFFCRCILKMYCIPPASSPPLKGQKSPHASKVAYLPSIVSMEGRYADRYTFLNKVLIISNLAPVTILMVIEGRECVGMGGGRLKLTLRAALAQTQQLKKGFVRRSQQTCHYRLFSLFNGALLSSQGPRDNAATLWGGILHLLSTKLNSNNSPGPFSGAWFSCPPLST